VTEQSGYLLLSAPVETILSVSMRAEERPEGRRFLSQTGRRIHPSRQGQTISGGPDSIPITSGWKIFPSLSTKYHLLWATNE